MLYQTLRGIPLAFQFEWPIHPSGSGSDWFVLHGKATVADGSGLHADVSVNISRAVKDALPSLEPKDARAVMINAVRKTLDTRDLELLKSGKRQPVHCSSRVYSIVQEKWTFNSGSDEEVQRFLERKVYWDCVSAGNARTWIADPVEAMYFNSDPVRLINAARALSQQGLVALDAELASPTEKLRGNADTYKQALHDAIQDLESKHAYERA
jgi:hypothetical protein